MEIKLIKYVVSKKYSLLEQSIKTISWKASPSIEEKRQTTNKITRKIKTTKMKWTEITILLIEHLGLSPFFFF